MDLARGADLLICESTFLEDEADLAVVPVPRRRR